MRYRVVVAVHGGPRVKATVHSPQTLGRMPSHPPLPLQALHEAPTGQLYVIEFEALTDEEAALRLRSGIRPADEREVLGLGNVGACHKYQPQPG